MQKNNDKIFVYTIMLTDTHDKHEPYLVTIPAFHGHTEGKGIVDAYQMAKDYIGTAIMDRLDDHEHIPKSDFKIPDLKKSPITMMVAINASAYRRRYDTRAVKKTVTIPNNINEMAKERHINFSRVLTEALRKTLGVES